MGVRFIEEGTASSPSDDFTIELDDFDLAPEESIVCAVMCHKSASSANDGSGFSLSFPGGSPALSPSFAGNGITSSNKCGGAFLRAYAPSGYSGPAVVATPNGQDEIAWKWFALTDSTHPTNKAWLFERSWNSNGFDIVCVADSFSAPQANNQWLNMMMTHGGTPVVDEPTPDYEFIGTTLNPEPGHLSTMLLAYGGDQNQAATWTFEDGSNHVWGVLLSEVWSSPGVTGGGPGPGEEGPVLDAFRLENGTEIPVTVSMLRDGVEHDINPSYHRA